MTPYRGKQKKKRLDDVVCLQKQGHRFRTTPYRGKKKEARRRRLRAGTRKLSKPVMVHRTGRSDRGPDGSMLFSHGTVPYLKRTVKLNGSRVSRSDHTVRSEFNNLGCNQGYFMESKFSSMPQLSISSCSLHSYFIALILLYLIYTFVN